MLARALCRPPPPLGTAWQLARGSGRARGTGAAPTRPAASMRTNQGVVQGLEPALLWGLFEELCAIPRPSKHEGKVLEWLKAFAKERGLATAQDAVGNLVIRRPGSAGGEAASPVIIQGHVDMVTEKDAATQHDFFADGLTLRRDGEWLKAAGTTLGADNGIGVCAALGLLDQPPSVALPPLECLFTVDEETGLTGAMGLDAGLLTGRTLLNLDTEEWGEVFVGCAGGGDSRITLPLATEELGDAPGFHAAELSVGGLQGGHSGLNIHEDRGNAVALLARVLGDALVAVPAARLEGVRGGDKRNAIAREAAARLLVPTNSLGSLQACVAAQAESLAAEYGPKEPQLAVGLAEPQERAQQGVRCLTAESCARLLTLLTSLPHGVLKYSHAVPGLVETSNNLASVACEAGHSGSSALLCTVICSTRSSLAPALEAVRERIRRLVTLVGGTTIQEDSYPGWAPNPQSQVVQLTAQVMEGVTQAPVKVGAIHAGLECGLLGEKLPGVDMVSYGPTIRGAHSPNERVHIPSVEPFWRTTLLILERLAGSPAGRGAGVVVPK